MAGKGARRGFHDDHVIEEHVIEKIRESILRYCKAHTRSGEDAEDAVQDVFIRYLAQANHEVENPERWLISAARHACADTYRTRATSERHAARDARVESPNPEVVVVDRLFVQEVLARLAPRDRAVLTRLYLEGQTTVRVAQELGVPQPTMRVIAQRARDRARAVAISLGQPLTGIAALGPLRRLWERSRAALRRCGAYACNPTLAQMTGEAMPMVVVALALLPVAVGSGVPAAQVRAPVPVARWPEVGGSAVRPAHEPGDAHRLSLPSADLTSWLSAGPRGNPTGRARGFLSAAAPSSIGTGGGAGAGAARKSGPYRDRVVDGGVEG